MRQQFHTDGPVEAEVKLGMGRVTAERAATGTTWASVEAVDPGHEPSVRLAERSTITLVGHVLRVDVPDSGRLFRRAEVAVGFGLPADSGLAVKGGSADVTVRGGVAALAAKLGAGDVDVDEADAVAVKAGQTDVRIGLGGNVAVSAGQGSLTADRVGTAAFKAGQGSVELGRTDGSIVVKGGSVDLDLRESGPGEVIFQTGSGNATVRVAPGTTVELDLISASGDVRCDLPLESSAPSGGAGLRLRLRTGSGDLRVAPAAVLPAAPARA
ncbi:MAG: hypothetical protein NVS3B26_00250 [Mycobacteriales bacterium]